MNEEFKKFLKMLNEYDSSIYKYVYAKKIDYTYDPRYEDGTDG